MRKKFSGIVILISAFVISSVLTVSAQEKIYDDGRYFFTEIEKSYSVQPGGKLIVETQQGSIKIRTGTGNTVEVNVVKRVDARSEDEAKDAFERVPVYFDQRGDDGFIETDYPGEKRLPFFYAAQQVAAHLLFHADALPA